MVFQDDRTDDQRKTHYHIVMMTDRVLSGWGGAGKGPSYAGWACRIEDLNAVDHWVRSRSDALRVRHVGGLRRPYRVPSIEGHCHIYVVDDGHPSLHAVA